MVTYPRIPGHEIAATIESVGADVPRTFKWVWMLLCRLIRTAADALPVSASGPMRVSRIKRSVYNATER